MTCYLLPIKEPEAIYTIKILRYNPEYDDAPHWESYSIPYVNTMTVVEALEYYRASSLFTGESTGEPAGEDASD